MMIEQGLPQVNKHKVVVLTITYNHSKYIEDALKGFAMQQTNFPFLCCVFDDASTDGEQEVLKKWIENHCNPNEIEVYDHPLTIILKAPDKMNPNCIYIIHLQKVNTWGKPEKKRLVNYWSQFGEYIALCEGDDYWIDSNKLQKQVDFMETNLDYSMCFHNAVEFYEDTFKLPEIFCKIDKSREVSLEEITESWIVPTASMLYRKTIVDNYPKWTSQIYSGDLTLQLIAYSKGRLFYMNKIMSFYRKTYQGESSSAKALGKLDYIYMQHALLYKLFNEYTNYQYQNVLNNRISYCEKYSRFLRYRKRSNIIALIRMPMFFLYKLYKRLINLLKILKHSA